MATSLAFEKEGKKKVRKKKVRKKKGRKADQNCMKTDKREQRKANNEGSEGGRKEGTKEKR